jgi:hypothetical protein
VENHGTISELDQRLGKGEGEGSQTGPEPADEDEGCDESGSA